MIHPQSDKGRKKTILYMKTIHFGSSCKHTMYQSVCLQAKWDADREMEVADIERERGYTKYKPQYWDKLHNR